MWTNMSHSRFFLAERKETDHVNETSTSIATVAQKIRDCLKEEGLDPELELREGEAIVAAHTKIGDDTLRVTAHVSTREFAPANAGATDRKEIKQRLSEMTARPTLEPRSAAGVHMRSGAEVSHSEETDQTP
jgi:hypothetical protein